MLFVIIERTKGVKILGSCIEILERTEIIIEGTQSIESTEGTKTSKKIIEIIEGTEIIKEQQDRPGSCIEIF